MTYGEAPHGDAPLGGEVAPTSFGLRLSGALPALRGAFPVEATDPVSLAGTLPALTGDFRTGAPLRLHELAVKALGSLPAPQLRVHEVAVKVLGTPAPPRATLTGSLPALRGAFAVEATDPVSLAGALPPLTGVFTAGEAVIATMAGTLPPLEGAFAAEVPTEDVDLVGSLPPLEGSFDVTDVEVDSDESNMVGGRDRTGVGIMRWAPAVVPPPASVSIARREVVAIEHGEPTIEYGTMPKVETWRAQREATRYRIIVGGRDVTYFRGVPTPIPSWTETEPLGWGPTSLDFPQINPAFETLGEGQLKFLAPGATVLIQRVNPQTNAVVAPNDYRGLIVAFDVRGNSLGVQVGGELTGAASMIDQQPAIFTYTKDLGFFVMQALRAARCPGDPVDGPVTGIPVRRLAGGQRLSSHLAALLSMAWDATGQQWTVMPYDDGYYRMRRKDVTTIDATAYLDDAHVVANLTRDMSEEPNRIFMTGVTAEGQRVRFATYPGLVQSRPAPYPLAGGGAFGIGTTNADTVNGDGITVMVGRLIVTKLLPDSTTWTQTDTYNAMHAEAVADLQREAGLPVTGIMTEATWAALWDLDVTGFSLKWAEILPVAQDPRTKQWLRSASGAILARNPDYTQRVRPVDATVDVGSGYDVAQMRQWGRRELVAGTTPNWVGSIRFNTGALIRGRHDPGDPHITTGHVLPAADLRPGMNIWLPLFDGGTLVHVSAVQRTETVVTATVDTRARDAQKVWAIMERDAESRRSPAREWLEGVRAVTARKEIGVWDEVGGVLSTDVTLDGGTWTVIPIVAGQAGQVRRLRTALFPFVDYALAVFGLPVTPQWLTSRIGNPLAATAAKRWQQHEQAAARLAMLYVAGSAEDPAGYYPGTKSEKDPRTGVWDDAASFSYYTFDAPVLYLAVYAAGDATLRRGRVMWQQLEGGV